VPRRHESPQGRRSSGKSTGRSPAGERASDARCPRAVLVNGQTVRAMRLGSSATAISDAPIALTVAELRLIAAHDLLDRRWISHAAACTRGHEICCRRGNVRRASTYRRSHRGNRQARCGPRQDVGATTHADPQGPQSHCSAKRQRDRVGHRANGSRLCQASLRQLLFYTRRRAVAHAVDDR
jgi:hypothetical protein